MFKTAQIMPGLLALSLAFMPFLADAQTNDQANKLEKVTADQKPISTKAAAPTAKAKTGALDTNNPVIRLRYPIPVPANGWPTPISGSNAGLVHINAKDGNYTISYKDWNITINDYYPQLNNVSWSQGQAPQLVWSLPASYQNKIISTSSAILMPIMKVNNSASQITVNYYCQDDSGADNKCNGNTIAFQYTANLSAFNNKNNQLIKVGNQGPGNYSFIGCIADTSDQVSNPQNGIVGGSRYIICCYKQSPSNTDTCTLE